MTTRRILLIACATFLITSPLTAQDATALKVKEILKARCYYCHGEDGAAEGGLNFILDHERLLTTKHIVPGKPLDSELYRQVLLEDMPKDDDPLSDEEKQLIEKWIDDGAPSFNPAKAARPFINPRQVYDILAKDILKQPEDDRKYMRYFSIVNLYNAGTGEDELETYRRGLSKLINSLSWADSIAKPTAVDPARTLFRIDLRAYSSNEPALKRYSWDTKKWDLITSSNPYKINYDFETADIVEKATQTIFPVVPVPWFVSVVTISPFYYDILGIPNTTEILEQDLYVNFDRNIQTGRLVRAGFNGSGVSGNNRIIERHRSDFGYYWKSYDFEEDAGLLSRRNIFRNPLLRDGDNGFKHDGGELIFSLPNGLQAYMLVDGNGKRIDKGPIEIVQDNKRPDRQVVNGLSCMSCHARGLIRKQDQIRATILANKKAFEGNLGKEQVEKILQLYPSQKRLDDHFEKDKEDFAEAINLSGGKVTETEPIVLLALKFESELDLRLAAAEAGLPAAEFSRRLKSSTELVGVLGRLLVPGGTVKRSTYQKTFGSMLATLKLESPDSLLDPQTALRPAVITFPNKGPKFILVAPGEFIMGGDFPGGENDHPPHKVKITKRFYVAEHVLTENELFSITGHDPKLFRKVSGRDSRVNNGEPSSWYVMHYSHSTIGTRNSTPISGRPVRATLRDGEIGKANSFPVVKLLEIVNPKLILKGFRVRLLTEAEWEYLARGGLNGDLREIPKEQKMKMLQLDFVNAYQLKGMLSGIQGELVSDTYSKDYYRVSPINDPENLEGTGPLKRGRPHEDSRDHNDEMKFYTRILTRYNGNKGMGGTSHSGTLRLVLEFIDDDEKKE